MIGLNQLKSALLTRRAAAFARMGNVSQAFYKGIYFSLHAEPRSRASGAARMVDQRQEDEDQDAGYP